MLPPGRSGKSFSPPTDMGRQTEPRMSECPISRHFSLIGLSSRHLLRHKQQDAMVFRIRLTEEPAKLLQHPCVLTRGSEQFGIGFSIRQARRLRRLFAIIKELVHRDFKCAGKFLKRFNSRNCMPGFHTRNIAAKQSRSFLNLTLRKLLFLTQCTQSITYNHCAVLHSM
jgi:hypothetical protein